MEHWAMQYINYVEITKPASLREKIKENLKAAEEKYK
jgi:predicted DNA-binding transcriptional regulator YafY